MPKEKNYNPVQAQRKADKAKEVKKGKAEAKSRRDEKLARKNPSRIQKQIDELKAVATGGGKLSRHEESVLEGLEKELKAVTKARDSLGDKAPSFGHGGWRDGGDGSSLGKRQRRDGWSSGSDGEDVPEDVRRIPMPRDTPPPIPKAELDRWYAKRRAKREAENAARRRDNEDAAGGDNQKDGSGQPTRGERAMPTVESKTVYEAKPIVRDLRKEAVVAFVPSSVQMKMTKGKGQGGLIEPEEADKLEEEGYLKAKSGSGERASGRHVTMEDVEEEEE